MSQSDIKFLDYVIALIYPAHALCHDFNAMSKNLKLDSNITFYIRYYFSTIKMCWKNVLTLSW